MQEPVVTSEGHLFSKQAIMQYFLDQKKKRKQELAEWEADQTRRQTLVRTLHVHRAFLCTQLRAIFDAQYLAAQFHVASSRRRAMFRSDMLMRHAAAVVYRRRSRRAYKSRRSLMHLSARTWRPPLCELLMPLCKKVTQLLLEPASASQWSQAGTP